MEKSGFFKSNGGDRVYRTNEIANFFSKIFSNGIFNNGCKVIANDNMTVTVTEGYAFINGYWYHNDSDKILSIELADANQSRIDNIVLRYTTENRNVEAEVIEGNYATVPVAPNLQRNTAYYDLRIAKINIPMGADKITQAMIEDCRFDSNDCGNVVSLIEQIDTSDIFNQYQAIFTEWFENLKLNLDENVATNLQKKMDAISDNMWEVVEIPADELDQWEMEE